MRNGKTLRQRFEEHGIDHTDSDEATHEVLERLEKAQAAAARRLFTVDPKEFGEAALTAAQKDATSDPRR